MRYLFIYGRTPCTLSEDALYKISLKNSDSILKLCILHHATIVLSQGLYFS